MGTSSRWPFTTIPQAKSSPLPAGGYAVEWPGSELGRKGTTPLGPSGQDCSSESWLRSEFGYGFGAECGRSPCGERGSLSSPDGTKGCVQDEGAARQASAGGPGTAPRRQSKHATSRRALPKCCPIVDLLDSKTALLGVVGQLLDSQGAHIPMFLVSSFGSRKFYWTVERHLRAKRPTILCPVDRMCLMYTSVPIDGAPTIWLDFDVNRKNAHFAYWIRVPATR